jgi:proline dehydrogenase
MLKEGMLYLARQDAIRQFAQHNTVARRVSRRFVAGETLDEAIAVTHNLNSKRIAVSLDHLGENTVDAREAQAAADEYIAVIERIHHEGVEANISVKLTALGMDISDELARKQLIAVLAAAQRYGGFVRVDMESSAYTQRTVDMVIDLHATFENVGTVIQSSLHRSPNDVERLIKAGVRVRLVKGAYLEPPTIAYPRKADVDAAYLALVEPLLKQGSYPAVATHDERIVNAVIAYTQSANIPCARFEFQMLYGIRRDLQDQLAEAGYNVRVYVPYGSQWYPYLTRRMAERPANLMFVVSNVFRN